MSEDARPPVNLKELQEQMLLQVELMGHDAHLRNFTPLRDRLVASGQDADAKYREIQSRRDQLTAELRKLIPAPVQPAAAELLVRPLRRGSLLTLPIASARFHPSIPGPWFGYAGTVQIGRAMEGGVSNAPGTKGTIYTVALNNSEICFGGDVAGQPIPGYPTNPGEFDPTKLQIWEHQWYYVIPFPAPVVDSIFTYSFDVYVQAALLLVLSGTLSSMAWAGDTANYTGQPWPPISAATVGWPLKGVQLAPTTPYVQGQSHLQRSLVVRAGHCPAVLLLVTIAAALEAFSEVIFDDTGDSFVIPGVNTESSGQGRVNFYYDPIPPESHP